MADTAELFTENIDANEASEDTAEETTNNTDPEVGQPGETEDGDKGDEPESEFDAERAKEAIRKKNSEARNLRKRNAELAAELERFKNGETPDELGELRKENESLKGQISRETRQRIAAQVGLPESFADRLQGDDAEEWQEDAEALAAELKVTAKPSRTKNPGASQAEKEPKLSKADAFFSF